jgi:hypothetical protein
MNNYILRIKRIASDYWDIADIDDKDIAINLGASQIGDFGITTNDYTQRINLPFTYKNESIFAAVTNNFARSQAPYQNYECRLQYRNREIFGRGSYLTILKVSNKNIEICISSGAAGFFEKLRDIDFTSEEYQSLLGYTVRPLTLSDFQNEEYNPVPSGTIYPKTKVARWGEEEQKLLDAKMEDLKTLIPTLSPASEAMLREAIVQSRQSDFVSSGILPNAYPCVMLGDPREDRTNRHAWGILTKLFDHLGYTLESNVSSFLYYCFSVPMRNANKSIANVNYTSYPSQLQEGGEPAASRCYFYNGENNGNGHALCERNLINGVYRTGYQIGIGGEGIYPKVSLLLKFPDIDFATMPVDFETELTMFKSAIESGSYLDNALSSVNLLRSDFIVKAKDPGYHVCSVVLHYNGRTEVNGVVINAATEAPEFGAYKDDYIGVWQNTIKATDTLVRIPCFLSITHEVITSDYAVPGTRMYIAPNIVWSTAEDFFKTFIRLFGFMVEVDEVNKVVKLNTLSEVYDNRYLAIDWSDKLDISQTIEEVYKPDGPYAKKNILSFTKNEKTGKTDEAYATINNKTLSDVKTMCGDELSVESADPHSVTWLKNTEGLATEWEDMEFPQFFHYGRRSAPFSSDFSHYSVQPVTAFECLEWYDYLFGIYSDEYIFKDYLKITAYFNLNEEDIANFKQRIPVFIRKFGAFFYVNKIKNYIAGKTTQVELIRL